jgi:hypothetical protein
VESVDVKFREQTKLIIIRCKNESTVISRLIVYPQGQRIISDAHFCSIVKGYSKKRKLFKLKGNPLKNKAKNIGS